MMGFHPVLPPDICGVSVVSRDPFQLSEKKSLLVCLPNLPGEQRDEAETMLWRS